MGVSPICTCLSSILMDLKWWACHRNASKPAAFQSCYQKQWLKATKHSVFSSGKADPVHLLRGITWTSIHEGDPLLKKRAKWSRGNHPSRWKIITERYHGKICSADGIGEDREVLLKFLHQLKNSQGPEQLESPPAIDEMGDISPHWQISPPSQRSLTVSFENGQRDAAGCISTPSWVLCDGRCQKLLWHHKLDLAGTFSSPNIRLKTLICSRSKQNPNRTSKPQAEHKENALFINSQTQSSQDTVHDTSPSTFEGSRLSCWGFFSVLQ